MTWGLTHSGLESLSHTDFLPVTARHTEPLCLLLGPASPPSALATRSSGLGRLMRRVTQSRADTVQTPPPHTRLPRAAAALRRRRPVPHPSWCRSKFPGQRASPELADSSNRKSRRCFPTAHGQAWSRGRRTRRSRGRGLRDGRGPVRGRRRDRTRGRGAQSPGCGIRRASELPQRRGEAGGATRVRILLLHRGYLTPGWGSVRPPYLPARGSSSSPAPGLTRRRGPAPRAHGRPRRLRAF